MNMNPYFGFRKEINFKSYFFQLFRCCTKNESKKILINVMFRKIMPVAITIQVTRFLIIYYYGINIDIVSSDC